jgi:hypothetical protein
VIVPAISQNQLSGLVRFLLRQPQERLPCVVCHLMFPPHWTPWGQVAAQGERFYQDAFRLAAPLTGRFLFFTVENKAMQELFRQDFGIHAKCHRAQHEEGKMAALSPALSRFRQKGHSFGTRRATEPVISFRLRRTCLSYERTKQGRGFAPP